MLLEGSVYSPDLTDTNALVLLSDSKVEHTYYDYHGSENTENSGVQLIQEAVSNSSISTPTSELASKILKINMFDTCSDNEIGTGDAC